METNLKSDSQAWLGSSDWNQPLSELELSGIVQHKKKQSRIAGPLELE